MFQTRYHFQELYMLPSQRSWTEVTGEKSLHKTHDQWKPRHLFERLIFIFRVWSYVRRCCWIACFCSRVYTCTQRVRRGNFKHTYIKNYRKTSFTRPYLCLRVANVLRPIANLVACSAFQDSFKTVHQYLNRFGIYYFLTYDTPLYCIRLSRKVVRTE